MLLYIRSKKNLQMILGGTIMNKTEFINELSKKTGCTTEECVIINEVLESKFIISKKNKNKIVEGIMNRLSFDEAKADEIYNTSMQIITSNVKDKLKHPFRSQD